MPVVPSPKFQEYVKPAAVSTGEGEVAVADIATDDPTFPEYGPPIVTVGATGVSVSVEPGPPPGPRPGRFALSLIANDPLLRSDVARPVAPILSKLAVFTSVTA